MTTPMDWLQTQIHQWHVGRWPSATIEKITLKFAEEAGELVGAVVKSNDPNLQEEMGDALICLAVLAGRKKWSLEDLLYRRFESVKDRAFPYDPDEQEVL